MRGIKGAFTAVLLAVLACASAVPASAQSYSPGDSFRDCPTCPEMVVVPAGTYLMGSSDNEVARAPAGQRWRYTDATPLHQVTIAAPFAVGKFEVTFAEWDACVAGGGSGAILLAGAIPERATR